MQAKRRVIATSIGLGLFAGCGANAVQATGSASGSSVATNAAGATTQVGTSAAFCASGADEFSPKRRDAPGKNPATERATIEKMISAAPAQLAADVNALLEMVSADSKATVPRNEVERLLNAGERVLDYVAANCPDGAPYFSCLGPHEIFRQIASAVNDAGPPASEVFTHGATPEAAVGNVTAPASATQKELDRDSASVTFGWLNDKNRLVQRVVVKKEGSEWTAGRPLACAATGDGAAR